VLWIGAAGLLLIVGYVALLNWLIIWLGRRVPRPEVATASAAAATEPPTPSDPDAA